MSVQQWKVILDFPDYAVSSHGLVKRAVAIPPKDGRRGWPVTMLAFKWAGRKREYAQVCLRKDGQCFYRYVHILVAEAFIANPLGKPTVNHENGVKSNNRIDNLAWATYAEQTQHGLTHGLIVQSPQTGRFA